jgi:D-alanyl-D-alanine carboxypeptidase
MLVANTAGYIDYVYVTDFSNLELAQPFRAFTDEELINYSVRDGKMMFAPGTSQHYSHTDNVILGQFIERATGRTIKQWYAEKLFGPLGMTNTYFPINQNIRNPVLHAFTSDRSTKKVKLYEDCTYWNPSWGSTPGLPISDLDDLGKWGPAFGTGRLLTPELFKEQIAPTSVGLGKNKPDLYFVFGFAVANGWYVQNPAINGYSGGFAYKPSIGVTITAEATQSETATSATAGFEIIRQVSRYVDPAAPSIFNAEFHRRSQRALRRRFFTGGNEGNEGAEAIAIVFPWQPLQSTRDLSPWLSLLANDRKSTSDRDRSTVHRPKVVAMRQHHY